MCARAMLWIVFYFAPTLTRNPNSAAPLDMEVHLSVSQLCQHTLAKASGSGSRPFPTCGVDVIIHDPRDACLIDALQARLNTSADTSVVLTPVDKAAGVCGRPLWVLIGVVEGGGLTQLMHKDTFGEWLHEASTARGNTHQRHPQ